MDYLVVGACSRNDFDVRFYHPLRRQLFAELVELQSKLDVCPHQDETTKLLKMWKEEFHAALKLHELNENTILEKYTTLLKKILTDPLTHTPIIKPYLGTDGKTYDKKSLLITLSLLKQKGQPCPELKVEEHDLVNHFIDWFNHRNQLIADPEVVAVYFQYKRANLLASLPIKPLPGGSINFEEEEKEILDAINREFQPFLEERRARWERQEEMLSQLKENDRKAYDALQEELNKIQEDITRLKNENKEIQGALNQIKKTHSIIDRQNATLHQGINNVERAINERKKNNWLGGLGGIALTLGLCCIGTWGLSLALQNTCVTSAVVTPTQGGLKAGLVIPF